MGKRNYAAVPHEYLYIMKSLDDAEFGRLIRGLLQFSATGDMPALRGREQIMWDTVVFREEQFQQAFNSTDEARTTAAKQAADARWGRQKDADVCEAMRTDANACERMPEDADVCEAMRGMPNTNTNTNTNSNTPPTNVGRSTPLKSPQGSMSAAQEQAFDQFWAVYPKKKSKGQARKAWSKINPSRELFTAIMDKLQQLKNSYDWKKDRGQYIPYPATWLNAEGWNDEVSASPPKRNEPHHENPFLELLQEEQARELSTVDDGKGGGSS